MIEVTAPAAPLPAAAGPAGSGTPGPVLPEPVLAEPVLSRSGLRRVLAVLCLTEIVSWGVLYYAFPVLAPTIARDTGWSPTMLSAAFSAALVVAAFAGIPVGRILDRWGPRAVMTTASVLGGPAIVLVATARSPWTFFAGWLLAGVAMAGTMYPPAFAALTRWWAPRQVTALTLLTMIAGVSSTVFAPLTAALVTRMDWRTSYLVLAAVLAVITVPLHLWGLRGPWPAGAAAHPAATPGPIARSRPFLQLTVAMALAAFAVYAVLVNLVPLLLGRGLDTTTAALALGLGGLGQVIGRIGYRALVAATGPRGRAVLVIAVCAVTTALIALVPGPAPLLVALAVVVGMGRGIFTLLQATAVADRWGTAHYGRLNGILSAPSTVGMAVAPFAGMALVGVLGGFPAVFVLLAVVAAVAAVLVLGGSPAPVVAAAGTGAPVTSARPSGRHRRHPRTAPPRGGRHAAGSSPRDRALSTTGDRR